jgi:death on curing protein
VLIRFLTLETVLEQQELQLALYGGMNGVRERGLLDSALAQPMASFGGQYLHTDLYQMAAAYLYHLALNHAFIDGNKRIATAATLLFLEINGLMVEAPDDELVNLVLETAQGNRTKQEIADFFRLHSKEIG